MYQLQPNTLRVILTTLTTAYAVSFAVVGSAQVTSPLPKQGKTEAQCSFRDTQVEVLYREGKTPWMTSKKFIDLKGKALQKALRKKKRAAKKIKEAVAKLRKQLSARDKQLLEQCRSELGGIGTGPGGPGGGSGEGLVPIAKQNGYTLYLYQSRDVKHSFGSAISDKGAISGTFYKQDPALDPSSPGDGKDRPGNRFYVHGQVPNSPFVWSNKGLKKACNECTGLTLGKLIDSQTLAIGDRGVGIPGATASSVLFNYATGALSDGPRLNGLAIVSGDINESGRMTGSVQKADKTYDAVLVTAGLPTELSRSAIVTEYDTTAKLLLEQDIKRQMYQNQERNDCSDAEIETTSLIPGGRVRDLSPSIFGIRLSDSGYLLGSIVEGLSRWDYVGECVSGTHYISPGSHTFVVKPDNSLQVIPANALPFKGSDVRGFASGIAINNGGIIAGSGMDWMVVGSQIARLNAQRGDREWQLSPIAQASHPMFMATDISDRGTIVGTYSPDVTLSTLRACMVTADNALVDLNNFMGLKREAGLTLETATGINSCQTIVGNAWNEKTKQNQLFLLAPDNCPIPS